MRSALECRKFSMRLARRVSASSLSDQGLSALQGSCGESPCRLHPELLVASIDFPFSRLHGMKEQPRRVYVGPQLALIECCRGPELHEQDRTRNETPGGPSRLEHGMPGRTPGGWSA